MSLPKCPSCGATDKCDCSDTLKHIMDCANMRHTPESLQEFRERIEKQRFVPAKYLFFPFQYKDTRWADHCLKYSALPWWKRLFVRKPNFKKLEPQMEEEIEEIRKSKTTNIVIIGR